tara:strand:+ start:1457 stop:1627 length:171 start_codon:yes stop_codon:yes gene_type:complete
MKVGDLVKEKYVTERIGVIVSIYKDGDEDRCKVLMTDGTFVWAAPWHFWEVADESR